jgi:hypothetical protein
MVPAGRSNMFPALIALLITRGEFALTMPSSLSFVLILVVLLSHYGQLGLEVIDIMLRCWGLTRFFGALMGTRACFDRSKHLHYYYVAHTCRQDGTLTHSPPVVRVTVTVTWSHMARAQNAVDIEGRPSFSEKKFIVSSMSLVCSAGWLVQ